MGVSVNSPETRRVLRSGAVLAIVWSLIACASLVWSLHSLKNQSTALARNEATAYINKDIAFRNWASSHGGVYIPPTATTPANPYLSHLPDRDVITTSGKQLTLMNPAYMLRDMQSRFPGPFWEKGRITSLRPLNPINTPDAWERSALQRLERGEGEVADFIATPNGRSLRMMRPFYVEKACLKCHGHQGYKEGDLRGGIDVTLDLTPILATERENMRGVIGGHSLVWLSGLGAIGFLTRRNLRREKERQVVQHALEESEERLRQITTSAQDAMVMIDAEGRVTYWNPAAERMFGFTGSDAMGKDLHSLIMPARYGEAFLHGFSAYRENGAGPVLGHVIEIEGLRADGSEFPVELSVSGTTLDGQRFAIGIIRDISDRRKADQELRQLNATLEQRVRHEVAVNREKDHLLIQQSRLATMGEMLHNVAHQWRQPLTTLTLILSNIEDAYEFGELTPESLRQMVAKGNRIAQGMSTTIDDFRNFFRKDQIKTHFALDEVVRQALSLVEASFKNNNIALEVEIRNNPLVQGFPGELAQVLLNVLVNAKEAIRAREGNGKVTIVIDSDARSGQVSIRDNGGGIAPEILPRIFDPYFTSKETGSGIGLYMSRMIMDHMGGQIEARNVDGGTEFRIAVPIDESA